MLLLLPTAGALVVLVVVDRQLMARERIKVELVVVQCPPLSVLSLSHFCIVCWGNHFRPAIHGGCRTSSDYCRAAVTLRIRANKPRHAQIKSQMGTRDLFIVTGMQRDYYRIIGSHMTATVLASITKC